MAIGDTCTFFNKQYKITTGFFSENTIVVAEGEMLVEGIFQVSIILILKVTVYSLHAVISLKPMVLNILLIYTVKETLVTVPLLLAWICLTYSSRSLLLYCYLFALFADCKNLIQST